jgi:hypothetical protein
MVRANFEIDVGDNLDVGLAKLIAKWPALMSSYHPGRGSAWTSVVLRCPTPALMEAPPLDPFLVETMLAPRDELGVRAAIHLSERLGHISDPAWQPVLRSEQVTPGGRCFEFVRDAVYLKHAWVCELSRQWSCA